MTASTHLRIFICSAYTETYQIRLYEWNDIIQTLHFQNTHYFSM